MTKTSTLKEDFSLVSLLKTCTRRKDLNGGARLHDYILKRKLLEKSPYLASTLINMYAKCGMLTKARQILEELPVRDAVMWSTLISGYSQQSRGHEALICFNRMQSEGLTPDAVTFSCILKACGSIADINKGKHIHKEIVSRGFLMNNVILGTSLVDMYVKCGALDKAQRVFEELPVRDVVSWNALISGYAQWEKGREALNCFEQMKNEGISPNVVTFICILLSCANIGAIHEGEKVHEEIMSRGFLEKDVMLGNSLVHMYAKCGVLKMALKVLEQLPARTTVSWNALITGHVQQGQNLEALKCFEWMQSEGLYPDSVTFACLLKACGSIGAIENGKRIHEQILNRGLLLKDIVLGTALVDMYAKCGAITTAQEVLEEFSIRNVVCWNALITGYAQQGKCFDAFVCFRLMQRDGFSPNAVTFICILQACGSKGALDRGALIHEEIMRAGLLENNIVLGTALVDMYAKCGVLSRAKQVLKELPLRNIVSWSALIAGYAQQGRTSDALTCFEQLLGEGLIPNEVTFLCVLSACVHSGLLDKAQTFFNYMTSVHGIIPNVELHTCMVMGLGCAGHVETAMSVISSTPFSAHVEMWLALLRSCGTWGNMNLGRMVFHQAQVTS